MIERKMYEYASGLLEKSNDLLESSNDLSKNIDDLSEKNDDLLNQINQLQKRIDKFDVIEEVPEKSLADIIREVAEEENMSEEEVREALKQFKKELQPNRATKPKRDKVKAKSKKKSAKLSKKKNRK